MQEKQALMKSAQHLPAVVNRSSSQQYVWSRGPSKHTNQDFLYHINNMYEAGALQNTQIRTSYTISTICMKQGPFKTHKSGLPIPKQQYVWSRGPSKHTNQDFLYHNNMYEAGVLQNTPIRTSYTITICMKQGPFKTHKSGLPIPKHQYVWRRGPSKHTNQDFLYHNNMYEAGVLQNTQIRTSYTL